MKNTKKLVKSPAKKTEQVVVPESGSTLKGSQKWDSHLTGIRHEIGSGCYKVGKVPTCD